MKYIFVVLIGAMTATAAEPVATYHEALRPQFHFTCQTNWLNDPNGLAFYHGEYHLFFQHVPVWGVEGNQTWGHAISRDLVHWTQLPHAILPDAHGPIWSGSAVVDWKNTAGFQNGPEKTLVAIYTAAGGISKESKGQPFAQCIAYSNDRGRTWTKYAGNPVVNQLAYGNRDPKVIWHAPTHRWVMVIYKENNSFCLFSSPDLKNWTLLQELVLPGCAECPDFFEIPIKGHGKKWILSNANGNYVVGSFDGHAFTKEIGPLRSDWGKNYYAAQTYSDIPSSDGRRIQIGWMRDGSYPNMPFNQQMSFPCELTLRALPEGDRLCRMPVREIKLLHGVEHSWSNLILRSGENPLEKIHGDLFDIDADIDLAQATDIGFKIRGEPVQYSLLDRKLTSLGQSAPLDLINNHIKLRILVDRTSVEVFANDGRICLSSCFLPKAGNRSLQLFSLGGPCRFDDLKVCELHSAW